MGTVGDTGREFLIDKQLHVLSDQILIMIPGSQDRNILLILDSGEVCANLGPNPEGDY